jgi:hypothetical protein
MPSLAQCCPENVASSVLPPAGLAGDGWLAGCCSKSFGIARGPRRRCRVCDIGNRDPAGLKDPSAGSDSAAEAHFSNAGSAMNEGTAKIRAATADIQAATG